MSVIALQWIAHMYPGKVGRDHLGLGSVSSDQILPSLSPGINVLTHHPRYHSFYVFLLDEFWRSNRERTYKNWVQFFRPREFIFSLGAFLCEHQEHGEMGNVVGAQKTEPLARQQKNNYDTYVHYIDSPLGGYGLYYRSVMVQLGLIYPGGPGFPYPVDVPTDMGGRKAAEKFRQHVASTTYYKQYFQQDNTQIPLGVIQEYIEKACLCQLKVHAPDRPVLLDHFLHGGIDPKPRRDTFRMFMDIADQTDGFEIYQDDFRQILYFGATESGVKYVPKKECLPSYNKWRLYQAKEYYSYALNALWCHLCDWGLDEDADLSPINLDRLWEYLESVLDGKLFATALGQPIPNLCAHSSIGDLKGWLCSLVEAKANDFDVKCGLDSVIHEHMLYEAMSQLGSRNPLVVPCAVTLLCMIILRFGQPELWLRDEWSIARMGEISRLSLHSFLTTMHEPQHRNESLYDLIQWLYRDYIILQHELVANSKLPENTYRFQREGNRLRFFNLYNSLGFSDSRYDALSTSVYELGLCGDLHQPHHPLAADGHILLAKGDLI